MLTTAAPLLLAMIRRHQGALPDADRMRGVVRYVASWRLAGP